MSVDTPKRQLVVLGPVESDHPTARHLVDDLSRCSSESVVLDRRDVAAVMVTAAESLDRGVEVVIVDEGLVINARLVDELLDHPSKSSSFIAGRGLAGTPIDATDLNVTGVLGAGPVAASPDRWAVPPMMLLRPSDSLAVSLRAAAGELGATDAAQTGIANDAAAVTVAALLASDEPVRVVRGSGYVSETVSSDAATRAAEQRRDAVDEHDIARRLTIRPDDGWFSTHFVRPISSRLSSALVTTPVSSDAVTVVSIIAGLAAAALFATGSWPASALAALVALVSLLLDCIDGELARLRRRFSAHGAILDAVGDKAKEIAVLAALAYAADQWLLASAVLGLLAVRHCVDFGFHAVGDSPTRRAVTDVIVSSASQDSGIGEWSTRTESGPIKWLKRIASFPVGERWLVIAIGGLIGRPTWTLAALAVGNLCALGWMTLGRVARRPKRGATAELDALMVSGSARLRSVLMSTLGFLAPAVAAAVEISVVVLVARWAGADAGGADAAGFAATALVASLIYLRHFRRSASLPWWAGAEARLIVFTAAVLAWTG